MFSLICVGINGWVNNRKAGELRRHRAHYDVIIMIPMFCCALFCCIDAISLSIFFDITLLQCHWVTLAVSNNKMLTANIFHRTYRVYMIIALGIFSPVSRQSLVSADVGFWSTVSSVLKDYVNYVNKHISISHFRPSVISNNDLMNGSPWTNQNCEFQEKQNVLYQQNIFQHLNTVFHSIHMSGTPLAIRDNTMTS